jgi:hypothetical protein
MEIRIIPFIFDPIYKLRAPIIIEEQIRERSADYLLGSLS